VGGEGESNGRKKRKRVTGKTRKKLTMVGGHEKEIEKGVSCQHSKEGRRSRWGGLLYTEIPRCCGEGRHIVWRAQKGKKKR